MSLPIYWIAELIPSSKNIWVFGAWYGKRYSDNSRYLFEHVIKNEPTIKAVWITKEEKIRKELIEKGLNVYKANSILGFWYCSRAKVSFFTSSLDDINRIASSHSIQVQLWHGTPLKKIGYDDDIYTNKKDDQITKKIKERLFPFLKNEWNFTISPSNYVSRFFYTAFKIDYENILVTGYPRGDIILAENPKKIKFIEDLKKQYTSEKIIMYTPTFRSNSSDFTEVFNKTQLIELDTLLNLHNAIFIVKMHYINEKEIEKIVSEFNTTRIIFMKASHENDLNYLLPWVDMLITDFSSVFFDFLLLKDRPIIFYPFDYENYMQHERNFYVDYNKVTPGDKCYSWKELIYSIEKHLKGIDKYRDYRRYIATSYNQFFDVNNSERLCSSIKDKLSLKNEGNKKGV
ncbi:CDP-glycerol glycerophosphotransferase family protein [Priestia flexa]